MAPLAFADRFPFPAAIGLCLAGIGLDTVTTTVLVQHGRLHEANPIAALALELAGGIGLFALKLGAIGVCLLIFSYYDLSTRTKLTRVCTVTGIVWALVGIANIITALRVYPLP